MTPSQFTALMFWLEYIKFMSKERHKPKQTTKDLLDDLPPF